MESINALGRRKAAVARVYLSDGKGKITVNGRDYKEYFGAETLQYVVTQPLVALSVADKYDINVNLDGGGVKGQAEALRLGITRALIQIDPECKTTLKAQGFVTRDPREVERKKPGQPKARKRFQFSKR
ncbi:MAG: 30S ribosomal protein S9 [Bacteroidetes bacterium GWE2_41_25]|nr:MAG: 30S ribosomal protein S9 [Bacteroidetes bacterium GWA2_40_15]OFX84673.1 MAG: 30S ribosomal protein S9 [Bacteroidetes bacterium GWC2_40_22]OFY03734.1 MAG: 30S ribosomal protein S9 [Bacteroidetes bacterium GWE2_41_25]OFY62025.1 MAG: 30S ribosomal protein S9 [Bacteroidetes bacterium GWF2_41_9]HBH83353.1 30S ribosomal protein S9 [Bacteroidales bacterium]